MRNTVTSDVLPSKQSRFIDEYMVDMNGAAAAERAGYSAKTSRAIAYELLTKPDIQACQRRLNIEPPCRFNNEPGRVAKF